MTVALSIPVVAKPLYRDEILVDQAASAVVARVPALLAETAGRTARLAVGTGKSGPATALPRHRVARGDGSRGARICILNAADVGTGSGAVGTVFPGGAG